MAFIHCKLRNRLLDTRVQKLLFVYINMEQLEKKRKREDTLPDFDDVDFADENGEIDNYEEM